MIRRLVLAGIIALTARSAAAQQPAAVVDVGPGAAGPILAKALAAPHDLRIGPDTLTIAATESISQTLIVVASEVLVDGRIDGNLIVIGGPVFVHPGARVTGRIITMGDGAYIRPGAMVQGGTDQFPDVTFDTATVAGRMEFRYRDLQRVEVDRGFSLPGVLGLQTPSYDRTDGLSIPYGVSLGLPSLASVIDPSITYRSNLGVIDPAISDRTELNRRTNLTLDASRATRTNDAWIAPNWLNSLDALASGTDLHDWYRADRADAELHERWEGESSAIDPYIGVLDERAWSIGPAFGATGGPWSFAKRHSPAGMDRLNPPVAPGTILSALAGAHGNLTSGDIQTDYSLDLEFAAHAPTFPNAASTSSTFAQATAELQVSFPTFGTERYQLEIHGLGTSGTAPPQRWQYLGGRLTLPSLSTLQLGGDQLLFVDSRYDIPIDALTIPHVGPPVFAVHEVFGSAGVGHLPGLTNDLGARLTLSILDAELFMDTQTRHVSLIFGLAAGR